MIKLVVMDLDGTLWDGNKVIPGANDMVKKLQEEYKLVYLTNNSSKSREQLSTKLTRMGFKNDVDDVYGSAYITSLYLQEARIDNVYVMGSMELKDSISDRGTKVTQDYRSAENLVVGFDIHMDYDRLVESLHILMNGGKFIACNEDRTFPSDGRILPGSAAMVGAVAYSANKRPDFVVGKPGIYSLDVISRKYDVRPSEILVIGDSYESDIKMAEGYGCKSIITHKIMEGGYDECTGI